MHIRVKNNVMHFVEVDKKNNDLSMVEHDYDQSQLPHYELTQEHRVENLELKHAMAAESQLEKDFQDLDNNNLGVTSSSEIPNVSQAYNGPMLDS